MEYRQREGVFGPLFVLENVEKIMHIFFAQDDPRCAKEGPGRSTFLGADGKGGEHKDPLELALEIF